MGEIEILEKLVPEARIFYGSLGLRVGEVEFVPYFGTDDDSVFVFNKKNGKYVISCNIPKIRKYGLTDSELILVGGYHEMSHGVLDQLFPISAEEFAKIFNSKSKFLELKDKKLFFNKQKICELSQKFLEYYTESLFERALASDILTCYYRISEEGYFDSEIFAEYLAALYDLENLKKVEKSKLEDNAKMFWRNQNYVLGKMKHVMGLWLNEKNSKMYANDDMLNAFDIIIENRQDVTDYIKEFLPK